MDSFLFEMTGLDGEAWSVAGAATRLWAAAEEAGHTVEEGEPIGDWRKLDLVGGPLPSGTLMVSGPRPGWAFTIVDDLLGDEDDPVDEAQASAADLLRRCCAAAPLYLGTAVWPFGPEVTPSYDTSAPFVAVQAGPVMYVSAAYADTVLGGRPPDPPKGWAADAAGDGHVLVVEGNLLREPDDPAVRRLLKRLQPSG